MQPPEILRHLLVLLLCTLPLALILRRFGQSTIVGYLLTGLAIGPGGLRLIPEGSIETLADVGVALLLFTVGIELSLGRLARARRIAFLGGTLQVAGTTVVVAAAVQALTGDLYAGVFVGC